MRHTSRHRLISPSIPKRGRFFAYLDNLIARRDDRYLGPPVHGHVRTAERRQQRDAGVVDAFPAAQYDFMGGRFVVAERL